MPDALDRALTFDDLLGANGYGQPQFGGVSLAQAPDGGLRLDPRYAAQLAASPAPAAQPSPAEQAARGKLAYAFAHGLTNNDDEIRRVASFRDHAGWQPATADNVMWNEAFGGAGAKVGAALSALQDRRTYEGDPGAAYGDALAAHQDWLDQRNKPPTAAGSIDAARAELARKFATQRNNDDAIYRTGAFRDVSPTSFVGPFADGLTMGTSNHMQAGARAINDALHGGSLDSYPRYLAAERDSLDRYKTENPKTALALELAGMAAGNYLTPTRLLRIPAAATLTGAVAQSAFNGGIKGLLAGGVKSSDGSLGHFLEGTFEGGLTGAGDGARDAPFGFYGRRVGSAAWNVLRRLW